MSQLIEKSPEFYPPKQNNLLVRFCHLIAPLIARWLYQLEIEIEPKDLEKLAPLKKERLLILPNHVILTDWIVIFLLSAKMGAAFYYLAAHESFKGLVGKVMQQIGVYSIRRGLADRRSVAQTLEILMQPASRLVIFPEGGCSYQNDTVIPFRPGAIQLALQAMNRIVKQDKPLPNLYLLPVSLKYRYLGDMTTVIDRTLSNLEKTLNITQVSSDFYQRLRAVAGQVLLNL